MIEELLCVFARFWSTSQPHAFGNRPIDQLFFRRGFENFVERSLGCLLIDLLQPKVMLQAATTDRAFAQAKAGVTLRELRIVEIAVLTQARDNFLDVCLRRAAAF